MVRIVLLVLVVLIAVMVFLAATRWPRSVDDSPRTTAREKALLRARVRLEQAQARYAAHVREAEQGLVQARQDVPVLELGSVVLGRCTVLVGGREHELTAQTVFEFEHGGQIVYLNEQVGDRLEITPRDERRGTLRISGPGWDETVGIAPADFSDAERLAAAGRAAVRTVEEARRDRTKSVGRAWERLERARADTAEVDEARMTLEDLQGSGPLEFPDPPGEDRK